MWLVKGSNVAKKKSEFGGFELQADEGWTIFLAFLGYESNLLVVIKTKDNEADWINHDQYLPDNILSIPVEQRY